MGCLNCGKELTNTPGKRPKKFCTTSCRSSYGQKKKRAGAEVVFKKPGRPKVAPVHIPPGADVLRGYVAPAGDVYDRPKLGRMTNDEPKMWEGFQRAVIYDQNGKAMTDEEVEVAMNKLAEKSDNRKVVNPDSPVTKQMKEPAEGTNAFFLKYGAYYKKDIPK